MSSDRYSEMYLSVLGNRSIYPELFLDTKERNHETQRQVPPIVYTNVDKCLKSENFLPEGKVLQLPLTPINQFSFRIYKYEVYYLFELSFGVSKVRLTVLSCFSERLIVCQALWRHLKHKYYCNYTGPIDTVFIKSTCLPKNCHKHNDLWCNYLSISMAQPINLFIDGLC